MSSAKPLPRQDLELILERTAPLWEEVRGHRILLTGGTGFFGRWLVESFCFVNELLGLGAEVTLLTRNPEAFARKCPHLASNPAVKLHSGDVRNFLFPEEEYKYVIHAATESSAKQAPEDPVEMLSTIVAGTERTLEFAATHGTRKFLLTSSGAVYGKHPADVTHVPESYAGAPDPLDASNVYAGGKRTSELLCAIYQKKSTLKSKLPAAGLSAVRIFHWTSTSPSATSSGMFLQAGRFRFRGTAPRDDLICMPPTWPCGCGRCCFVHRRLSRS